MHTREVATPPKTTCRPTHLGHHARPVPSVFNQNFHKGCVLLVCPSTCEGNTGRHAHRRAHREQKKTPRRDGRRGEGTEEATPKRAGQGGRVGRVGTHHCRSACRHYAPRRTGRPPTTNCGARRPGPTGSTAPPAPAAPRLPPGRCPWSRGAAWCGCRSWAGCHCPAARQVRGRGRAAGRRCRRREAAACTTVCRGRRVAAGPSEQGTFQSCPRCHHLATGGTVVGGGGRWRGRDAVGTVWGRAPTYGLVSLTGCLATPKHSPSGTPNDSDSSNRSLPRGMASDVVEGDGDTLADAGRAPGEGTPAARGGKPALATPSRPPWAAFWGDKPSRSAQTPHPPHTHASSSHVGQH
jgi:hypothetical protein